MTGESVKPCPICNKGPKTWNDDCDCGAYGALHDVSDCDFVDHWNQAHCWKEISALREALTKEKERGEKILKAEHDLSDAYIRLRSKLNAFDTPYAPTGEQVWSHTEQKLDEVLNENAELRRYVEELHEAGKFVRYCMDRIKNKIPVTELDHAFERWDRAQKAYEQFRAKGGKE